MPHQTGVLDALKDWGLTVVEVDGWRTRGSSSFDPHGHVLHHDVIGPTTKVPDLIILGRDDLPGPLCNFWLERNGRVHLVAAGRANHAGEGGWKGLSGNSSVWGTEMNNLGVPADEWPEVQLEAMARVAAATCEFSGFGAEMVPAHHEWTDRKIDPHTIDMGAFRRQIQLQEKEGLTVADIEALRTTIIRQHQKDREMWAAIDRRQAARDRADAKAEREAEQEIIKLLAAKDDG